MNIKAFLIFQVVTMGRPPGYENFRRLDVGRHPLGA
jgi:hypothetical protein